MNTPVRTPRAAQSRDSEMRPAVYVPPSTLPSPDPQPGTVFRWVATSVMGVADPANMSKRLREGWEPVKAEDHPELHVPGNASGNVEIGGLILCRGTVEQARARDAYYNKQATQQMESVDNSLMQQSDPRMPLFKERTSEVSRGRGFGSGSK
jgi:hypothetical protein